MFEVWNGQLRKVWLSYDVTENWYGYDADGRKYMGYTVEKTSGRTAGPGCSDRRNFNGGEQGY